jgi:hypothetical protein
MHHKSAITALATSLLMGSVAFADGVENHVGTALSSTTLSGFVDTSANWNFGEGAGAIPGRSFDNEIKSDGFNLNVVNVTLSGESDTDDGWGSGYMAELLFGPDANLYGSTSTGANDSDFAIKQAYVQTTSPIGNGLTLKLGVFDTLIGYEVFGSRDNANYSRAYSYFIEPFAQTGLLASYDINDVVSVSFAVANTWNTIINARATDEPTRTAEDQKTYLGAITFTAPESLGAFAGASLTAAVSTGFDSNTEVKDITSVYVGGSTPTPIDGLTLGIAWDHRELKPAAGGTDEAMTLNAYLSYELTDDLTFNGRTEWAKGDAGTWGTVKTLTGDDEEIFALTATAQYDIWENVLSRLELRWDSDQGDGPDIFNNPPQDETSNPESDNVSLTWSMVFNY